MAEEIKKTDAKGPEKKPVSKKPGFFTRIKNFLKEVRSEGKKVVWPTPKQVLHNTIVVIVIVVIMALFIAAVDFVFKTAAGFIA